MGGWPEQWDRGGGHLSRASDWWMVVVLTGPLTGGWWVSSESLVSGGGRVSRASDWWVVVGVLVGLWVVGGGGRASLWLVHRAAGQKLWYVDR